MIINHMYMCIQVLHAILMITLTLCTEPEFKIRIVELCFSADLAPVSRRVRHRSRRIASPRKSEATLISGGIGLILACMIGTLLTASHAVYILGKLPSSSFHLTLIITSPLHILW